MEHYETENMTMFNMQEIGRALPDPEQSIS